MKKTLLASLGLATVAGSSLFTLRQVGAPKPRPADECEASPPTIPLLRLEI